jgi:hypothetical protein
MLDDEHQRAMLIPHKRRGRHFPPWGRMLVRSTGKPCKEVSPRGRLSTGRGGDTDCAASFAEGTRRMVLTPTPSQKGFDDVHCTLGTLGESREHTEMSLQRTGID